MNFCNLGLEEEFEWVILCLDNGYFEMNMCKIFVELNLDGFFFLSCLE